MTEFERYLGHTHLLDGFRHSISLIHAPEPDHPRDVDFEVAPGQDRIVARASDRYVAL